MGSTLLFLLLIIVALYFITFSPIGSSIFKPYIKKELEEKIGMPIDINTFDLEYGTANLEFSINKQALVNMEVSQYDLLNDTFEGIYHITTDKFTYENKKLNKLDIKGSFKYLPEDLFVEGEGTAFNGKVDYHLNIIDNLPQQILLNVKDAQLSEVLQIAGHPDIAEGKIDVKINIPDMCGDRENIYGYIDLKKSYLKTARVKELYDFNLPEKSYLYGRIDGNLEGENVKLVGDVQSNLFVLQIKNAFMSVFSEDWGAEYDLDVKDMRLLTKNKLAGILDLKGKIKGEGKQAWITSKSNSLEGTLHFVVYQGVEITFEKIALEKLLSLLKLHDYARGDVNGIVKLYWFPSASAKVDKVLSWHDWTAFSHDLRIDNGVLTSKAIEKMPQYEIPVKNTFSFESKGKIAKGRIKKLKANVKVHSILVDMTFLSLIYDFEKKVLASNYDILIHDLNAVISKIKVKKDTPVSAKGSIKVTDKLSISGETKSLGKKVAFSYDSKTVKVDAFEQVIEKILELAGVPLSCYP